MQFYFSIDELKTINSVINHIHDDSLPMHEWSSKFLNLLREQVYFDKGNLMLYDFCNSSNIYEMRNFVPIGWKQDDIQSYVDNYIHIDDVLPILSRPVEIAFRCEDIFSVEERKKTRYYKEFVKAVHLETSIDANIPLKNECGLKAILGFFRDPGKRNFTEKELEIVKVFQPHLTKALGKRLIEESTSTLFSNDFIHLLNQFESLGICVVNSDLEITSYNSAYKEYVTPTIKTSIIDSTVSQKILQLCEELKRNSLRNEKDGIDTVQVEIDNQYYCIEIIQYSNNNSDIKYVCLLYSMSDFFMQRLTLLKEKYEITNREFEILCLLLRKGMTNEEIAKHLFISPFTVKKHMSSIYQKIGINSQKQLLGILKLI